VPEDSEVASGVVAEIDASEPVDAVDSSASSFTFASVGVVEFGRFSESDLQDLSKVSVDVISSNPGLLGVQASVFDSVNSAQTAVFPSSSAAQFAMSIYPWEQLVEEGTGLIYYEHAVVRICAFFFAICGLRYVTSYLSHFRLEKRAGSCHLR
jgi:hypothetical protein